MCLIERGKVMNSLPRVRYNPVPKNQPLVRSQKVQSDNRIPDRRVDQVRANIPSQVRRLRSARDSPGSTHHKSSLCVAFLFDFELKVSCLDGDEAPRVAGDGGAGTELS